MNPDCVRVTACRLCDSRDLDLVVAFTPTPPGDQYVTADRIDEQQACYPLDVLCCADCGAVQLGDTVDPKLIYPEYLYTTSVSRLSEHFARYAREVMTRVVPREGARVVDIGSNDGTLLRHFVVYGCDVIGIDPALSIATKASINGIPTYCTFFTKECAESLRSLHGPADIITANHIFANVADLHDFTNGVKYLLAPDGTFVFETGYWPAIVRNRLIDTIEHEHIHYFGVRPLEKFFARHGLTLVHVEAQPTKGGSLRGYVQHADIAKPDGTITQMIACEENFTDRFHLALWVRGLQRLERDIVDLIGASNGETWVGYGAAVGSTLLLHQFALGDELTCLVDDNPLKQGRYSPGHHLEVYAPCELAKLQPDRVVILAWRYAEQIMRQHPDFAGKFIVPLPTLVQL